ncbi:hypothetical protein OG523_01140 [Streptomyces virginiae]|uniref:hypothetical protein n=1 Tax=Streptomyces virginiae TaxID=1961 RepID=UPI002E31DD27|nr:hypothetical protein [Streptomyces virginiae]
MPNNNEIPTGPSGSGDDEWNDLVRRLEAEESGLRSAPRPRRVWPLNLTLALAAVGAAFVVLKYTGVSPGDGNAAPAPAVSTPTRASSAAPSRGTVAAAGGTRPMVPLAELFPAEVKGGSGAVFTRLGSTVMESCTEPDGVGPRLAAMIEDSAGCVGEQIALYKDDRNNQFNVAVFTMKDPQDTLGLVTELAMAFDDYQVAVQGPPPGSGLPTLPADSGLVQAFTGHGRVMVVAMGQWSDGRTADFQQLVDRMKPLQDAVSQRVGAHEGKS